MVAFRALPARDQFVPRVERLLRETGARVIADLGGGANPVLSVETIRRLDLDYTVFDLSRRELAKAPAGYPTEVADLSAKSFEFPRPVDLAISRMLLEHVREPAEFHRNILRALSENGHAIHFFPTLYALPFLANAVLPEGISAGLVRALFPSREDEGRHGKFPARYRWCRGPTKRQRRRFEKLGYEIQEYVGFFGHSYYSRVGKLQALEDRVARTLERHPAPALTSFAWVVLSPRAQKS